MWTTILLTRYTVVYHSYFKWFETRANPIRILHILTSIHAYFVYTATSCTDDRRVSSLLALLASKDGQWPFHSIFREFSPGKGYLTFSLCYILHLCWASLTRTRASVCVSSFRPLSPQQTGADGIPEDMMKTFGNNCCPVMSYQHY